jgi:hypothetical protein
VNPGRSPPRREMAPVRAFVSSSPTGLTKLRCSRRRLEQTRNDSVSARMPWQSKPWPYKCRRVNAGHRGSAFAMRLAWRSPICWSVKCKCTKLLRRGKRITKTCLIKSLTRKLHKDQWDLQGPQIKGNPRTL